jgi:uracil-DNA glycosylase
MASSTTTGVPAPTRSSGPCGIDTTTPAKGAVTASCAEEATRGSLRTAGDGWTRDRRARTLRGWRSVRETASPAANSIVYVLTAQGTRSPAERREALKDVLAQARACERCPELAATRKTVVFGSGNADAQLMFVGEAPGASEDEQGIPFVGRAGKLLDQLLGEIGLERSEVFVCNTLKCRPPGNRDPLPVEIENCQEYLRRQVELIEPSVICTLGNFATKLLRGDPTGITRLHGKPENVLLGRRAVRLYPIYHPAAALYTPSMLATLREDFVRLPELLAQGPPEQPPPEVWEPPALDEHEAGGNGGDGGQEGVAEPDQLGLF